MAISLVHKQYFMSPYHNYFICFLFENLYVVMRCHKSSESEMGKCEIFFFCKVDVNWIILRYIKQFEIL